MQNLFESIPNEVWKKIYSYCYLTHSDFHQMIPVCKRWMNSSSAFFKETFLDEQKDVNEDSLLVQKCTQRILHTLETYRLNPSPVPPTDLAFFAKKSIAIADYILRTPEYLKLIDKNNLPDIIDTFPALLFLPNIASRIVEERGKDRLVSLLNKHRNFLEKQLTDREKTSKISEETLKILRDSDENWINPIIEKTPHLQSILYQRNFLSKNCTCF